MSFHVEDVITFKEDGYPLAQLGSNEQDLHGNGRFIAQQSVYWKLKAFILPLNKKFTFLVILITPNGSVSESWR